jgi:regulator of replication initiation timing
MTHYVESPAGQRLEVYSDDDLLALLGSDERPVNAVALLTSWQPRRNSARGPALTALWVDGPAVDRPTGRAALVLRDRALRYGLGADVSPAQVTATLSQGAFDLFVERDTNGKRTYEVRLIAVAERWLPYLSRIESAAPTRDADPTGTDDAASPAASVPEPAADAIPGGDVSANGHSSDSAVAAVPDRQPVEVELTNAVATALLTQVVEIISTGKSAAPELGRLRLDVEALEERLGVQVEYVSSLRKSIREAGDEIAALKVERDGLRQRLRAAEHNLKVATGADAQRIIDAEVRRQLDHMMRRPPAGAHSKVAS